MKVPCNVTRCDIPVLSNSMSLCPAPGVRDTPAVFPIKLVLDDPEKIRRDPPSSQMSVTYRLLKSLPKTFDQIILIAAVCVQWVETNV